MALDTYKTPKEGDKISNDGRTFTWTRRDPDDHCTVYEWIEDRQYNSYSMSDYAGMCG